MFWEFATDSYDIGFGVYFEWTVDPPTQVSVQVSESSDEEDLDEEYPEGQGQL
jgi:golgi resident protein GCP60